MLPRGQGQFSQTRTGLVCVQRSVEAPPFSDPIIDQLMLRVALDATISPISARKPNHRSGAVQRFPAYRSDWLPTTLSSFSSCGRAGRDHPPSNAPAELSAERFDRWFCQDTEI